MTFPTAPSARYRQIAGFSGTRQRNGNDSLQREWLVSGASSPAAAETYLISEGVPPPTIDFTPPASTTKLVKLDKYTWREAVDGNETAYIFSADYSFEKLDVDEWSLSVSTSGGTIRVTNSFGTTSHPASGETAPDFGSAIDVRDGKAQGIDRVIPAVKYTVNYRMTRPADPVAFAQLGAELTGTVNSTAILGHAPYELLFLGPEGNFGNQKDPELQFSWVASKNATLSIGDIAGIPKIGHDYLWILYEDEDTGSGATAYVKPKPRAAYVERIYTAKDHTTMGLLL